MTTPAESEGDESTETSAPVTGIRAWIARTRPLHGPLLLVGGILWDFLTFRTERVLDNVLLGVYLVVFAGAAVVQLRVHARSGVPGWLASRIHWVHNLGQFLLGGLLSAYLIHYFRGAPLLRGLVWLLVLGTLALVNEFLPRWIKLPETWVPLLSVLAFHFALASGPVMLGVFIGFWIPALLSLLIAFVVQGLAVIPLPGVKLEPRRVGRLLTGSSLGVVAVLFLEVVAMRLDLIPPLPLRLMATDVVPDGHEDYEAGVVGQAAARLGIAPTLTWTPGLRVQVKTPVYLPKAMSTTILHIWEVHDPDEGWTRTDAIPLDISGGRKEGYRTYSWKRALREGSWRVRVTTKDERELGRVRFDLVPPVAPPADG
jgi:hypothetical protein